MSGKRVKFFTEAIKYRELVVEAMLLLGDFEERDQFRSESAANSFPDELRTIS